MNSLLSVDVNVARSQQIYFPSVIMKGEIADFDVTHISCWKQTRALGRRSPAQRLFQTYFCIPTVQSPSNHTAIVITRRVDTALRLKAGHRG